jgi:hypothetical protein
MPLYTIEELRQRIAPIARAHGVARVCLFGSYARQSATPESDIDLKIDKGDLRSLLQLSDFRLAVEDCLQRPVDIITSTSTDHAFLREIEQEEVLLYERA